MSQTYLKIVFINELISIKVKCTQTAVIGNSNYRSYRILIRMNIASNRAVAPHNRRLVGKNGKKSLLIAISPQSEPL